MWLMDLIPMWLMNLIASYFSSDVANKWSICNVITKHHKNNLEIHLSGKMEPDIENHEIRQIKWVYNIKVSVTNRGSNTLKIKTICLNSYDCNLKLNLRVSNTIIETGETIYAYSSIKDGETCDVILGSLISPSGFLEIVFTNDVNLYILEIPELHVLEGRSQIDNWRRLDILPSNLASMRYDLYQLVKISRSKKPPWELIVDMNRFKKLDCIAMINKGIKVKKFKRRLWLVNKWINMKNIFHSEYKNLKV